MYGGVEVELHAFLISAIDRKKFQFHAPVFLLRGEGQSWFPFDIGWGPTSGLDGAEPRKIPFFCRESNMESSVVHSVGQTVYRLNYPGFYTGVMAKCKPMF
jgi:hypothetical protein